MKKLLTVLLSLAMILTTGTVAFAEEGTTPTSPYPIESVEDPGNSVDINVYAQYKNGDDVTKFGDPTYNVVVTWSIDDPISFTKKNVQVYKWDASQFKYVVDETKSDFELEYGSSDNKMSTVDINVKNLSDAKVYAEITYVQEKDSSDKALSKIAGAEEADITSNFNSNSSKVLDDIFGGATITSKEDFELLILKEWYQTHYAKNFYTVPYGASYVASDLIDSLTTKGANSPWYNTYKDKFAALKNAGKLSTTSDLLKLLVDDETLLDSDKTNFEAILGDDAPKIVYKVNGTKVMLTKDGEKFVASKDVNTNVKIGHFNVKVSVPNNG